MALSRIVAYERAQGTVTSWYRDHLSDGKRTVETVDRTTFIGRMVQHILPKGFGAYPVLWVAGHLRLGHDALLRWWRRCRERCSRFSLVWQHHTGGGATGSGCRPRWAVIPSSVRAAAPRCGCGGCGIPATASCTMSQARRTAGVPGADRLILSGHESPVTGLARGATTSALPLNDRPQRFCALGRCAVAVPREAADEPSLSPRPERTSPRPSACVELGVVACASLS